MESLLTEKQLYHIVSQWLEEHSITATTPWKIVSEDWSPASPDGMIGFLGDHRRLTLHLDVEGTQHQVKLFVKAIPTANLPKKEFINENLFFLKEMIMYNIFEEAGGADGDSPWRPRSYLVDEQIVVLADLSVAGYRTQPSPQSQPLAAPLARLGSAAIAQCHAAITDYLASHAQNFYRDNVILKKYSHLLREDNFSDTPWLRAGARLVAYMIDTFSDKHLKTIPDLANKLEELFLTSCDALKAYNDTLNIAIHRDIWVNNVMFKFSSLEPTNAVLLDFQCVRIAPPAFDVMIFLYLSTNAISEDPTEESLLQYYYETFMGSLSISTKDYLKQKGYSYTYFRYWCEKARLFGAVCAILILPYVSMSASEAQRHFDNPVVYNYYNDVDRSGPVGEYAKKCPLYRDRLLCLSEYILQRYML